MAKISAKVYQNEIKNRLAYFFDDVVLEWPISRGATDALSRNSERYSPRIDVAIGPFNNQPQNIKGRIEKLFETKTPEKLRQTFLSQTSSRNRNPRCLLAIEVVFSGSSKHILGDITNASMMGLFGLVIASEKSLEKVKRIHQYLQTIRLLEKAPDQLFQNVAILSADEILSLLSE